MHPPRLLSRLGAPLRALFLLALPLTTTSARADQSAMAEMGINSHLLRYADHAAACDEIIASGVKSVRLGIEWGSLQSAPGTLQPYTGAAPASANPTLLARLDAVVAKLTAPALGDRKVEILMQLHYGADWCSTAPVGTPGRRFYPPTPEAGLDAWATYVTFLATRYDGKISHWEVWNEPDSDHFLRIYTPPPPPETEPPTPPTPPAYPNRVAAYHALLTRAYNALKDVNSANKVLLAGLVMPSVNPGTPYMQVDFLDKLLEAGAGSKFDIMNYHAYGDAVSQRAKYLSVQAVLAKYGLQNRPVWLTETGYSTAGVASLEAMKADRIAQHWLNHMSYPNIERIHWYVDRNVVSNATNPEEKALEENFGLRAEPTRAPLMPWFHYQALDGAFVDFERQTQYPSLVPTQNTVHYTGAGITNYNASGSEKQIPAKNHMYFHVNDNWIYDANGGLDDTVYVELEYMNSPDGAGFRLDYDPKGSGTNTQLPVVIRGTGANADNPNGRTVGAWTRHTFTIPNVGFTNTNNGNADFRLYSGADAPLAVRNVVVRRRTDAARIKFGPTDRFYLMERSHSDVSGDANYNPALTYNGETCREIAPGKFIILRVSDAFVRTGDTRVVVRIRFWNDQVGQFHIQYNAADGSTAKSTTSLNAIAKSLLPYGWTTGTITLEDADFRNAGSYGFTDFRIPSGGVTQYVSSVEVAPLQLLPVDDFQDGDSNGWTTTGGAWSVVNESGNYVLRQTTTGTGQTLAVTGFNTWNDYDYSADVKLYHNTTAGLVARYTDANNYYNFAISTALDRLFIKKNVAGVTSTLADIPRDFTANITYGMRLVVNGPWITAFIKEGGVETQVAHVYDASLATGRVGVRGVDASYSADNVVVR